MRFAFVENAGPDNVRDVLCTELKNAREVCIAVAFVTSNGLDRVLQPLRNVAAHGKVHLLTGLYQHFTEPSALQALLAIQKQTRGRLSVRISREPAFHRKLYMVAKRSSGVIVVGSSNLTKEGLRSRGELNALLRLPVQSHGFNEARRIFKEDWKYAVDLNEGQIQRYGQKRLRKSGRPALTSSELNDILGANPGHRIADEPQERPSMRRVALGRPEASEKSKRIVSETTDWDDRGYEWWVWDKKPKWRTGDNILLFDCLSECLSLIRLKAFAESKVRNPDGKYFVAYKEVPRYKRRYTAKLWRELKAIGISKRSACDWRRTPPVKATLAKELKALILRVKK